MLEPLKRSGNRRYYRPEDVALVETIDRLVNHEGYTLKGARQAIEEGRVAMAEAPEAGSPPEADQAPETVAEERLPEPIAAEEVETAAAHAQADKPAVPKEVIAELRDIRERLAKAVGA